MQICMSTTMRLGQEEMQAPARPVTGACRVVGMLSFPVLTPSAAADFVQCSTHWGAPSSACPSKIFGLGVSRIRCLCGFRTKSLSLVALELGPPPHAHPTLLFHLYSGWTTPTASRPDLCCSALPFLPCFLPSSPPSFPALPCLARPCPALLPSLRCPLLCPLPTISSSFAHRSKSTS